MPIDYGMMQKSQIVPQNFNSLQLMQQGQTLGQIARGNMATDRAMQIEDQRREIARQNATPQGFNYQRAAMQSAQAGDQQAAMEYDRLGKEHNDYLLKRQVEDLRRVSNTLKDVKTPEQYAYRRRFLLDNQFVNDIPEQYDPQYIEAIDKASEDLSAKVSLTDYDKRKAAYDAIQTMPEGPERQKAMVDYFSVASPGTGYQASPESIEQEVKKAIEKEKALKNPRAETAAEVEKRRTEAQTEIPTLKEEQELRKEYESVSKPYKETRDAYSRILTAVKTPSAAGDVSLIYQYMKMLDPGSTVREGEAAMAQNATGVPGRIINLYNNLLKGQRLTDDQRQDFINQSKKIYESKAESQKAIEAKYRDIATQWNHNPENVVGGVLKDSAGGSGVIKLVRDPKTGKLVRQ